MVSVGRTNGRFADNSTINFGLRYDVSLIPVTNNILGNYYDIFDFVHGTDIIQKMPPPCSTTQFAPCLPGRTCRPTWSFPANLEALLP